jgi:thymidylate synthase
MVAEWLWIWFGHQDVESITQYNPQIAKFSDDGIIFKGAYGPKVFGTMTPLICQLRDDPDSRQAIIQIYIRPDGPTKDVPCTMTAQFLIRDGLLNLIVNMRSSDIWLGLPYDVFNFTMIQNIVAALLGLNIGTFFMNLGSSHLYVANFEVAQKVLIAQASDALRSPIFTCEPPAYLDTILRHPRVPADRVLVQPWKRYADVLCATSNEEAFLLLKTI